MRQEHVTGLLEARNVKSERIVSMGQRSPPGVSYDQPWAEWVVVLAGSAGLRFDGEAEAGVLSTGGYVLIPAYQAVILYTKIPSPASFIA